MVKKGDKLNHPIHGELEVVDAGAEVISEFIDGEWRDGVYITAVFDRYIDGVQWRVGQGKDAVSYLRFHEYYLPRLQK